MIGRILLCLSQFVSRVAVCPGINGMVWDFVGIVDHVTTTRSSDGDMNFHLGYWKRKSRRGIYEKRLGRGSGDKIPRS